MLNDELLQGKRKFELICTIYCSCTDTWDCIATCFFIDTAHNVIDYIDTIWKILKPGGIWINVGKCDQLPSRNPWLPFAHITGICSIQYYNIVVWGWRHLYWRLCGDNNTHDFRILCSAFAQIFVTVGLYHHVMWNVEVCLPSARLLIRVTLLLFDNCSVLYSLC